jgi:hypothetical protein
LFNLSPAPLFRSAASFDRSPNHHLTARDSSLFFLPTALNQALWILVMRDSERFLIILVSLLVLSLLLFLWDQNGRLQKTIQILHDDKKVRMR